MELKQFLITIVISFLIGYILGVLVEKGDKPDNHTNTGWT